MSEPLSERLNGFLVLTRHPDGDGNEGAMRHWLGAAITDEERITRPRPR